MFVSFRLQKEFKYLLHEHSNRPFGPCSMFIVESSDDQIKEEVDHTSPEEGVSPPHGFQYEATCNNDDYCESK